jgi:hypothetical protein
MTPTLHLGYSTEPLQYLLDKMALDTGVDPLEKTP